MGSRERGGERDFVGRYGGSSSLGKKGRWARGLLEKGEEGGSRSRFFPMGFAW